MNHEKKVEKSRTKLLKIIVIALAIVIVGTGTAIPLIAAASQDKGEAQEVPAEVVDEEFDVTDDVREEAVEIRIASAETEAQTKGNKSMAAAIVVGLAAAAGAIGMALAISKAVEGTARQPEAGSKIQTMLMLGLVFIETAIIYALIVAILIIFVL